MKNAFIFSQMLLGITLCLIFIPILIIAFASVEYSIAEYLFSSMLFGMILLLIIGPFAAIMAIIYVICLFKKSKNESLKKVN